MSDVAVVAEQAGLLDRALRRVTTLWRDMADRVVGSDTETIEQQMQACLGGRGGEVSARNRAARLAQAYLQLNAADRTAFFRSLATFDTDPGVVQAAVTELAAATDAPAQAIARTRLRRALEPARARLLTQFSTIPDGMKFLVDLRSELLQRTAEEPSLRGLESDLKGLLASWFDVGFLSLERIDWHSSAALLEKLVEYEAVHRIRTWRDLKNRLDSDRRCYAFFHPRMPAEPLIFVEVALVRGLSDSVQRLLDEKAPVLDPTEADTAIFYSINNCQRGLDGISFGNFLIKRVVDLLGREFPKLKTYATLSPMPGFARWLEGRLAEPAEPGVLTEEEATALRAAAPPPFVGAPAEGGTAMVPAETPAATLARLLNRRWLRDEPVARLLEPILARLAAQYLLLENARGGQKRARDPVAHFHLSNGARVERLNGRADTSDKGLRESHGMMVNYLYDPAHIEDYHEDYVGEGKRAAASAVRKLARVR